MKTSRESLARGRQAEGSARGPRRTCLTLALLLALAGNGHAQAADTWTLQPPAQSSVAPGATLNVGVPDTLTPVQLAALAVAVDGIDVTALAQVQAGRVSYTPVTPLAPGGHVLTLVEYAASGQMIARGSWSFSVPAPQPATVAAGTGPTGGSATPTGSAAGAGAAPSTAVTAAIPAGPTTAGSAMPAGGWVVQGSAGVTANARVAQSDLTPPAPRRIALSGDFNVTATHPLASWTAVATFSGLYGSNTGTALTGQGLQPAQMQLALKHGTDSVVLGDQTIAYDNLLISGLSRRGVSANAGGLPLQGQASAFALRDSSLAGFYGGLGVTNPGDRVSGAMVQTHPLTHAPDALMLSAGFVSGTAPAGLSVVAPVPGLSGSLSPSGSLGALGSGTVVPAQSGSGNAWMVGFDSQLLGSLLQLHGQYAGSSFDFPGAAGMPAVTAGDHAESLGADFSAPLPKAWSLSANLGDQSVGTYFRSLANPALAPDQWTLSSSATLSGHGLALSANAARSEDNTDDNPAIATVRTAPRGLNLSYGPALPTGITGWLGTPSLSLAWQAARTRSITAPAGSVAVASRVGNDSATLNFAYPRWSWQLGWTTGSFTDYTGQQDDTRNQGPTLGVNLMLGASGMLGLNTQLVTTSDLRQGSSTLDRNIALTAGDSLFADRVSAQLSLSINHNVQQQVPGLLPPLVAASGSTLKTASAQIAWHALPATATRGGLDLGLSLSWNDSSGLNSAVLTSSGLGALATHGYQAFLTVSTTWPLAFGGQ